VLVLEMMAGVPGLGDGDDGRGCMDDGGSADDGSGADDGGLRGGADDRSGSTDNGGGANDEERGLPVAEKTTGRRSQTVAIPDDDGDGGSVRGAAAAVPDGDVRRVAGAATAVPGGSGGGNGFQRRGRRCGFDGSPGWGIGSREGHADGQTAEGEGERARGGRTRGEKNVTKFFFFCLDFILFRSI
jgi:hypothetical protein